MSDTNGPLKLSARAARAKPSATLQLNAKAKAMAAAGKDIVLFGAGEPDFPTPAHIRDATAAAMNKGATRYTPTAGIPELRKAVAEQLGRERDTTYAAEDVLVTVGAKLALYELFQAICEEGDEVIFFAPYWTSYPEMVGLSGATSVVVQTTEANDFLPDPAALAAAITPRTRAIVLNFPGNPTGAIPSRGLLEELAKVIAPTNALVVSDEIYDRICFDGRAATSFVQLGAEWRARTIVINGVSKSYAMTGFRIGWAAGPREIIAAMGRIQDQATSNPTSFAQYGALAAVTGPQAFIGEMRDEFQRRRDIIVGLLRALPGTTCAIPHGAFYALPSLAGLFGKKVGDQTMSSPTQICAWLLEHHGVALVPGEAFGAPTAVRLSFATSQAEIEKGVGRMAAAFAQLAG